MQNIVPKHHHEKGVFQGGHGKTFAVVFPSRADARLFTAALSSCKAELLWTSPRVDEAKSTITFRTERTVAERDRGRALSGAWKVLSPIVKGAPAFVAGMKFITEPRRGTIAVSTGLDMWDLVSLKPSADGFVIVADDHNLTHFGVSPEITEALRSSIASSAAGQ